MKITNEQVAGMGALEALVVDNPDLEQLEVLLGQFNFVPTEGDVPSLRSGKGWTPSGRLLLFESANSPDRLRLILYIGPGPDTTRQRLFDMALAHSSAFRAQSKSLNQKWNSIYGRVFLTPKDFNDAPDEQLAEEISKHWKRFLDNDLPAISDTLRREHWLWEHAEDSEV
jgi:hypothetical protein